MVPLEIAEAGRVRGFARKPDRAWLYLVPVCWITLWVYGWATLAKVIGIKQAPVRRDAWQKQGKRLNFDSLSSL